MAVLDSLEFGDGTAENEENLLEVFLYSSGAYSRVIKDEADVITGPKGCGKSAIYRVITETQIAKDLTVLPAANPTGTPVFKVLFKEDSSESRLRGIWTAYITSLVGNWIVDAFDGTPGYGYQVEEIRDILELLGLRRAQEAKRSLMQRIRRAQSIEAGAEGSLLTGALGASLKFELADADQEASGAVLLEPADFFSVLQKSAEVLMDAGQRLWVAFDRLDECFTSDSPVERRALRALLRTHLDISQALNYSRVVNMKIFLRSDLLARMSSDVAFTNSTHLRQEDIRWNSDAIADLIATRAQQSQLFRERYLEPRAGHSLVKRSWEALVPDLSSGRRRLSTSQVICERTADGNRGFNPRNVLSLFSFALASARSRQRRALDLGDAQRAEVPLLEQRDIESAAGDLSRRRLTDSVLNEFPGVAKYVRRLEKGPAEFPSLRSLMIRIGQTAVAQDRAEEILQQLQMSGVIGTTRNGYSIPRLYRASLNVNGAADAKPAHERYRVRRHLFADKGSADAVE
ncbi:hypothetical protein GCM10022399_41200 [Terrabacter ginsenosidimutans]|uniref:Uncharacterized protein n=2 Tax=Terrabacter ginsenosidimutans TaxID=490575 RepID=A0ABP7ELH0_9MICO